MGGGGGGLGGAGRRGGADRLPRAGPVKPGWFVLAVALGIASLFATGLLAASVAPTARGAAGIGWLLFFPNMFLAGVYFPTEEMSATMRQIGNFTPLGSALHAVRDSWMGIDPRPSTWA